MLVCKILIGALLMSSSAAQAQWQDLAAVRASAEAFVRDQVRGHSGTVEVSAAAPEPRLRLARCAQLIAFAPPGVRWWGPTSVGVRCEAPSAWSMYLPVNVRILDEVVVTTRAIAKGQTVSEGDVAGQISDITQLPPGAVLALKQTLGRIAKTPLAGGTILREEQLRALPLVFQGETVQVAFAGVGFEVNGRGRALTAAGLGETVSVKADSGRIMKGVVRARGSVWVH